IAFSTPSDYAINTVGSKVCSKAHPDFRLLAHENHLIVGEGRIPLPYRLNAGEVSMKRTRCSPNLESRSGCWSGHHVERQTRFLRAPSIVCFASALWISGVAAPSSTIAGTLDDVRARGILICGVSEGLPGFSEKDGSGVWRGFDVDFCKAIAAAVFGDVAKVEYRPLSAEARFDALKSRRIDLLSRNSTWTMSRELELGLAFA